VQFDGGPRTFPAAFPAAEGSGKVGLVPWCSNKETTMTIIIDRPISIPSSSLTADTLPIEAPQNCVPAAPSVEVLSLDQWVGDQRTLHDVSFAVRPGEVLAIAGGSGAGKTTLLEAMVGVRPAASGEVLVDGRRFDPHASDVLFGYVPQDDIIHLELPLRRTLEHAARLRLPAGTSAADIAAEVDRTLARLDLSDRADVKVGSLSGGQRKRASIASELLTDPHLFFLDEPTSGLDPATGAGVMRQLHRLAEGGTTIVVTTHAPADLTQCDRIVFLAGGGHIAFVGTPDEARAEFGVDDLAQIYEVIAGREYPEDAEQVAQRATPASDPTPAPSVRFASDDLSDCPREHRGERPGVLRQTAALAGRNLDLLVRNRLTLAILIGSPVFVIAMMVMLFGRGAFDSGQSSAMPAIQIMFWLSFSSVFFGVTYGLLQIVGEFAIFRRERFAGVSAAAYVASKIVVLAPVLAVVNVAMLGTFRAFGRLPALSPGTWVALTATLTLVSMAAVALGLLASAAVHNPAQATLALPMLCFPQVLFAGAVVAIGEMSTGSQVMSVPLAGRWGFESLGRILDVDQMVGSEPAAAGYVDSFTGSSAEGWIVLTVIVVVALAGTVSVLRRRTTP
jgi:ABC-type multidrug transport system ATPase subunit